VANCPLKWETSLYQEFENFKQNTHAQKKVTYMCYLCMMSSSKGSKKCSKRVVKRTIPSKYRVFSSRKASQKMLKKGNIFCPELSN